MPSHVPLLACDSSDLAVGSIIVLSLEYRVLFLSFQKLGCFASEFIQKRVCMWICEVDTYILLGIGDVVD